MTIHLDTNILPHKGSLRGGAIAALLRIARARGIDVVVPEIVLHESTNKRLEKTRDEVAKVRRTIAEASPYVPIEPIYLPEPAELAQQWEDDLREVFLVLRSDASDAAEALRREARRLPPASGGRGGRDSLIWLTVLRESQVSAAPTYFVSNNTADFAQQRGSKALHQELQREAEEAGAEIVLCTSVDDLLSHICERVDFTVKADDIKSTIDGDDVVSELLMGPWLDLLEKDAPRPWGTDALLVIAVASVKTHRAYQVDKTLLAWTTSECTLHFRYGDDELSHTMIVGVDAWVVYEEEVLTSIEVVASSLVSAPDQKSS